MAYKPEYKVCTDPEACQELHNPVVDEETGNEHHYGCECEACVWFYWSLKR